MLLIGLNHWKQRLLKFLILWPMHTFQVDKNHNFTQSSNTLKYLNCCLLTSFGNFRLFLLNLLCFRGRRESKYVVLNLATTEL